MVPLTSVRGRRCRTMSSWRMISPRESGRVEQRDLHGHGGASGRSAAGRGWRHRRADRAWRRSVRCARRSSSASMRRSPLALGLDVDGPRLAVEVERDVVWAGRANIARRAPWRCGLRMSFGGMARPRRVTVDFADAGGVETDERVRAHRFGHRVGGHRAGRAQIGRAEDRDLGDDRRRARRGRRCARIRR